MKYFNKRLGLTAEPSNFILYHYNVMIDDESNVIHQSLIEGSPDWEAVPDWVITAFKCDAHQIFKLQSDGRYNWCGVIYEKEYILSKPICYEIFSVRRSDGQEFKVGDKVTTPGWGDFVIYKFEIKNNEIIVKEADSIIRSFYDMQHAPAVLLTTFDGVEITNPNQQVFYVTEELELFDDPASIAYKPHYTCKYFSTQEAAESYISEHKKLYSLADIRKAWETLDLWHDWSDFANELKQVK